MRDRLRVNLGWIILEPIEAMQPAFKLHLLDRDNLAINRE
jgi:hypothetical protein